MRDIGVVSGQHVTCTKISICLIFSSSELPICWEMCLCECIQVYQREWTFVRGKLNSRCFHWFPVAMLESLGRAPTWRLHTKHNNFQWYVLPNNSSSEYRTSPKPWYVVYLLLLYDISISWLNLSMVNDFIFYLRDVKTTNWNEVCVTCFVELRNRNVRWELQWEKSHVLEEYFKNRRPIGAHDYCKVKT